MIFILTNKLNYDLGNLFYWCSFVGRVGSGRVDSLFTLNPIVHVVNMRSHLSLRGEPNIAYKYLKTSL